MLGSNVKTHQDIKTIVNNVLDISSGLSPEDVIQSTQVVERTLKRLHQVAMFEIELDALAKEQHDNALKKHFLVVANTVNKGIGRENLNARVLIPYLQGSLFRRFTKTRYQIYLGLNPLSTGKSVQTLPLFFSFVKQRLIEDKYFKVCISKVAV